MVFKNVTRAWCGHYSRNRTISFSHQPLLLPELSGYYISTRLKVSKCLRTIWYNICERGIESIYYRKRLAQAKIEISFFRPSSSNDKTFSRIYLKPQNSIKKKGLNFANNKLELYCNHEIYLTHNKLFHHSAVFNKAKVVDAEKSKRVLKNNPKLKKKIEPEKVVNVWRNMTVSELADVMNRNTDHVFEVMDFIAEAKKYHSINSRIEKIEVIQAVAKKSGFKTKFITPSEECKQTLDEESILSSRPSDKKLIKNRPPIVVIMGHVDHGKTTLLDTLRHSSRVSQEFGGITQHIGAFLVTVSSDQTIAFLDTPGHAAFSAMRARGAKVTDIAVLVVAADDGVMEQTKESIKHAEDANVPIIVAINKIDKPESNIEFCKKSLLQCGLQLEDYGGDIQAVPISASKGTNIESLIEAILAQAEVMELKANYQGMVGGTVIESCVDTARGKLCTALIQEGTLHKGAYLVAGTSWVKVRSMFDENGQIIQKASPSTPVEIIGWKELPSAGEKIIEVISEKQAQKLIDLRLHKLKSLKETEDSEAISKRMEEHTIQYRKDRELRLQKGRYKKSYMHQKRMGSADDSKPKLLILVKADVDGSIDAILDVLETYNSSVCSLDIIHFGVGDISQTDVEMASAFKGLIYGFNVGTHPEAYTLAKTEKVPLKHFKVIYRMIDDIKEEINQRLPLKSEERILGEANILQEFVINEGKTKWPVAGCRCEKGTLKKFAKFRLIRQDNCIHNGKVVSMRHLKNEVESIKKGVECGLRFEDDTLRFQPGDVIQCYETIMVKQTTAWNPGF